MPEKSARKTPLLVLSLFFSAAAQEKKDAPPTTCISSFHSWKKTHSYFRENFQSVPQSHIIAVPMNTCAAGAYVVVVYLNLDYETFLLCTRPAQVVDYWWWLYTQGNFQGSLFLLKLRKIKKGKSSCHLNSHILTPLFSSININTKNHNSCSQGRFSFSLSQQVNVV